MGKKGFKITAMLLLCIFSLACTLSQYVLLGMAGVQGQVDSLTQVAVPLDTDTPTQPVIATPIPEQEIVQEQTDMPSPTDETDRESMGTWTGTVEWQCTGFSVWAITMDFRTDGSCEIVITQDGETGSSDGRWTRSGNSINLESTIGDLSYDWEGTISGSTINGTVLPGSWCEGVWSAVKN